ncbi:hypothetical protein D7X12_40025 [Corallococcus sicarius]|uniref:Uncharacterized protein n=1 Tax=Corallococcus sicarius TaxID=2316726 RepID=A0A3A8M8Z6_9BACT|nr:hypothetical protein D7X12_40025 [Corallococcus sicarius]
MLSAALGLHWRLRLRWGSLPTPLLGTGLLRLLPGSWLRLLFGLSPRMEHHVLRVSFVLVRSDVVVWGP